MKKLYVITTAIGTYIALGETKQQAEINFSLVHPSQKIRTVVEVNEDVIDIDDIENFPYRR